MNIQEYKEKLIELTQEFEASQDADIDRVFIIKEISTNQLNQCRIEKYKVTIEC